MYDLLSAGAQASTPRDLFVRRYTNIHDGIGETRLTAQPSGPATATDASNSQVPFQVTHSLTVFGDVTRATRCPSSWSKTSGRSPGSQA